MSILILSPILTGRAAPYDARAIDKKRNDDYVSTVKSRDNYADKRDTFKRPVADYQKRDELLPSRGSAYDSRNVIASGKDHRYSGGGSHGLPQSDVRSTGGSSSFVGGRGGGGAGGRDDHVR